MDTFIARGLKNLKSLQFKQLTLRLLLHQGWLVGEKMQHDQSIKVL